MTEPDPRQRPQSFADVLAALEQMRRQPVSQWALRALLALVALVSVGILLLVLGVIPPFWQSDLDPKARTLQEEKSICDEFGRQLAALRPKSWQHLEDVQKRFEAVEQKLTRNRERLAEVEGAGLGLDQRPRLGDAYVQQGVLSQEVLSLKNVPTYRDVRDQLVMLQGKLPQTSTQAASNELARANETLASLLLPSLPLRDLYRGVEESVADCQRQRAEQVAVLRRRLDGGDIQQLPAAARDVAKAMQACDEGALTAVAEGIAASAERAAAITKELPKWPPTGKEGEVLDTATFGDALDALTRLDATNRDADLKAWWQRFADQARSQWAAQVTAAFTGRVAEVQALVAEFNVKAEKAREAGRADDALRRELTNVEAAINRIDRTREELDRLCERHQLPIELRRVLVTRTGTLSTLPGMPTVNFEDYEKLLSECVVPETVDPAITAARTELAERRSTLQQELGTAKTAAGRPELAKLTAASSALRAARLLFDQAVDSCRTLRNLPQAFDTSNVIDLRIECQGNPATKKYADLERLRASTLEQVEKLATARTASVQSLEDELRGGTDKPARIVVDARAVAERMAKCAEGQLAERASAIAETARLADEMQASMPPWRPRPELGRNTDDLKACLANLKQLEEASPRAGDALLRAWWTERRKAIVAAACADIATRWQTIQSALDRAVGAENASPKAGPGRDALAQELAAAQKLRSELLAFGGRPSQLKQVAELEALRPEVPGVTFPAGWPTRQFRAPAGVLSLEVRDNDECRKLYPADFLAAAAKANLRLWYFAERRDGQGPVYMAYCENKAATSACLVDVHPVTLREINVYFDARADYEFELENFQPETLAFNSSWRIADAFARLIPAAGGSRYTLPPADWRDWPRCQAFGPNRAVVASDDVKPTLKTPFEDVAIGGFAYLRSGVLEWTKDQQTGGVSEIRAPSGVRGARRIEVGFRLALDLVPVAR